MGEPTENFKRSFPPSSHQPSGNQNFLDNGSANRLTDGRGTQFAKGCTSWQGKPSKHFKRWFPKWSYQQSGNPEQLFPRMVPPMVLPTVGGTNKKLQTVVPPSIVLSTIGDTTSEMDSDAAFRCFHDAALGCISTAYITVYIIQESM